MKFRNFISLLFIPLLHSCYLDYTKWYDIGSSEKAWFVKDPKIMTFINDSTKQKVSFSLIKNIHDYEGFGYHDQVDVMEGEYYQFYYNCDTKYSIVLSTNGGSELFYFWDKTNKLEFDFELTMNNSEYVKEEYINGELNYDVLHYLQYINESSFNNNAAWYNTLRGTHRYWGNVPPQSYILMDKTETKNDILLECWYAKKQGFIKFVVTNAGKTYSFSRVL